MENRPKAYSLMRWQEKEADEVLQKRENKGVRYHI